MLSASENLTIRGSPMDAPNRAPAGLNESTALIVERVQLPSARRFSFLSMQHDPGVLESGPKVRYIPGKFFPGDYIPNG